MDNGKFKSWKSNFLYSTIILDIDYKHNHDLISSITTTGGVDLEHLDDRGPTFRRRTRLL